MISLADALKNRIESQTNLTLQEVFEKEGKEYQKRWAHGVQIFQKKINEDRRKENKTELPFISIRMKLVGMKEIDDLRWFYGECLKYEKQGLKEEKETGARTEKVFSKAFFGALKIK